MAANLIKYLLINWVEFDKTSEDYSIYLSRNPLSMHARHVVFQPVTVHKRFFTLDLVNFMGRVQRGGDGVTKKNRSRICELGRKLQALYNIIWLVSCRGRHKHLEMEKG